MVKVNDGEKTAREQEEKAVEIGKGIARPCGRQQKIGVTTFLVMAVVQTG